MNPLISVIVPVYEVEYFLPRCIKSILNQTYQNIEVILVDDGSPDHCPEICDEYVKQDVRLRVIHKKNGGLSDARNAGINAAKGDFFCFVDSDDWIRPSMLENLMRAIKETGVKLAIANIKIVDENNCRLFSIQQSPIQSGVFTVQELLPKLYQRQGWYYIVAWNKLYHRSLFEQICFPVGKIHEDEYIVAQIMKNAQRIVCIESEEYVYTYQRKGSIMNSRQMQSQIDWLEALYLRFKFCESDTSLAAFTAETRAVYFRELNNLFLQPEISVKVTSEQRRKAKRQYADMKGKSKTEKINWLLFQISPKLDKYIVQKIRNMRG